MKKVAVLNHSKHRRQRVCALFHDTLSAVNLFKTYEGLSCGDATIAAYM